MLREDGCGGAMLRWVKATSVAAMVGVLAIVPRPAVADLSSELADLFTRGGLRVGADGVTTWGVGTEVKRSNFSPGADPGWWVNDVGRNDSFCFAVDDLQIGSQGDVRSDAFDNYGQLRFLDPDDLFTSDGTFCYRSDGGTLIRYVDGDVQVIGEPVSVTWAADLSVRGEWYVFYSDARRAPLLRQSVTVTNAGTGTSSFILQRRLDLGSDSETLLQASSEGGVAVDGLTSVMRWAVAGHRDGVKPTLLHLLNGAGVGAFLADGYALSIPGAPDVGAWKDETLDADATDVDKVDQYYTVTLEEDTSVTLVWFVRASFAETGEQAAAVEDATASAFSVLDQRHLAGLPADAATVRNWSVLADPLPAADPTTPRGAGPLATCSPLPAVPGSTLTCEVTGGDPGAELLWRAATTFDSAGVLLGADGRGAFSFTVPATAGGREVTVELVGWSTPVSLGTAPPIPGSIPAGGGSEPGALGIGLAAAAALAVLRRPRADGVR